MTNKWDVNESLKIGGLSQEERRFINENKHAGALKKISIQEREELFNNIPKGSNFTGGTYGKINTEVAYQRSGQSFHSPGKTMKVASYDVTHQTEEGWGSQVQDPLASQ